MFGAIWLTFFGKFANNDDSLFLAEIFTPCQMITVAATSATIPLLVNMLERIVVFGTLIFICAVSPSVKWYLQHHKEIIVGPWDIAHIVVEE